MLKPGKLVPYKISMTHVRFARTGQGNTFARSHKSPVIIDFNQTADFRNLACAVLKYNAGQRGHASHSPR
jgi:hypothetical protein